MRVFCGTFNLNGKSPEEDLRPWLFPNQQRVDVYAVGFEEVVDLSTTSYLLQSDWLEREQRWIKACDEVLCSDSSAAKFFLSMGRKPVKYRRIVKYRMFGIMVLIYVSESIDHTMISEIFTAEVPTGNKGKCASWIFRSLIEFLKVVLYVILTRYYGDTWQQRKYRGQL